ncbi:hypothetical protein LBMAG27_22950 [Bacteroidota bacterium]|nr:hypothetical protein LBMAG27_22950 [Bacteroidota bacterium]
MYEVFLKTHSYLRWVVLILALITVVKYLFGWLQKKQFTSSENKISLFYSIAMDVQLIVGLVLYLFLSPITNSFHIDMKDTFSRFWGMEHIAMMVIAIALVHIGRVMVKKAKTDVARFSKGTIYFLLSLLIMLASIPWPFREIIGRPLF